MPWSKVGPKGAIPHLSILDASGEVDEELVPDLSEDQLLQGLRTMLLGRRFDERRLKLQRSGRIGTFAPVNGQEAAQLGAISAIRPQDWFIPSYRETVAGIWRGIDLADVLIADAGYNEGVSIPQDAHDLPNAVPVGTQMLQAAGIAYGARRQGKDEIAMTFFGDGATSQGDFHEAMNFASVFDCPVVFICQNNQYAISVPRSRQTRSETLAQKALAYGIDGVQVDGNDVFATFVAAQKAVASARDNSRPSLIECVTYRLEMHTTADDPGRYRDDEEVEEWREKDPIERFRNYLRKRDLLDDGGFQEMEEEVSATIDAAWKKAEKRIEELGAVAPLFDHVMSDMPAELERQKRRMQAGGSPGVPSDA
ncbi:pyruvate dehydrogenase (acetyl-transferring) E1 component subunit alpha [Stappia sp. F7233]|uniref:Pyruvate dehydrogenase E1 component subunit alpha n=1 Tax=Stappia albiluteola TaxID=2758565 RepID=A0A839AF21_9HYPH|nr:pyruvate dehydrogenase (acetyl-transferring) E1 component subunit alpha [Stappia albiluteola]MBA5777544.1 pyruvate dehydrogenase (acetyl-transferring) E1 component subunit alpha [Stappia albiluteola]